LRAGPGFASRSFPLQAKQFLVACHLGAMELYIATNDLDRARQHLKLAENSSDEVEAVLKAEIRLHEADLLAREGEVEKGLALFHQYADSQRDTGIRKRDWGHHLLRWTHWEHQVGKTAKREEVRKEAETLLKDLSEYPVLLQEYEELLAELGTKV